MTFVPMVGAHVFGENTSRAALGYGMDADHIDRQVVQQCRRGLLELDLLLNRFLQKQYTALSQTDRQRFYALLDRTDTELLHWLTGKEPCEPDYADLIEKIGSR